MPKMDFMNRRSWLCLALLALFRIPLSNGPAMASPTVPAALIDGNNSFAADLYHALDSSSDNIFLSPLSISTALTMTWTGARQKTADQIQEVLHLPADPSLILEGSLALHQLLESQLVSQGLLEMANSIWPDRSENLLPSFVENLNHYFHAEAQPLDFAQDPDLATSVINRWVADRTKDRITHLLQPGDITTLTRLVLANAIVFDGRWATAFDPRKTAPLTFQLAGGNTTKVPGMSQQMGVSYLQMPGYQVLELPFQGDETTFLIALPDQPTGLPRLEKEFSSALLASWDSRFQARNLNLILPRFQLRERLDLSAVLKKMGLSQAFTPEADFSGISAKNGLFIDKVIHQATLDIKEEGAQAAAATAVLMKRESATPSVVVNRPFLFLIRDRATGGILFMGRLLNPGT